MTEKVFRITMWHSILNDFCNNQKLSLNKLNNHQYRISNDKIKYDVYPVSQRYHNIFTGERGDLLNLIEWLYTITYNKQYDTSTNQTPQED